MYSYTHDPLTGGLLLNDSTSLFSREPRPVYYRELDALGFSKHYSYARQDDLPYMWAEANCYWYRGRLVARTKGGTLYTVPELELEHDSDGKCVLPEGENLIPVDIGAMVEKNRELLEVVEQTTIKKIFDVYRRYRKRLDCFHVAFSGGKDSTVLLDLVKKALPKSGFVVIFGDTGMEFPDTYEVIRKVEEQCKAEDIEFYRASSHLSPEESWRIFGPPSRVHRWCCSVHKSVPQTLKLREVVGKEDYVGMDFVGVRAHESVTRAEYDYENYGRKQKGQYSHNPILDWTSAEIWLYIYAHQLVINETYKKGNPRAGCLFCPMGGGKSDSFRYLAYGADIEKYTDLIREMVDDKHITSYITNGGWVERRNGRDLKNNAPRYEEETRDGFLTITVTRPNTNWQEWIKTLGAFPFEYKVESTKDGFTVRVPADVDKTPQSRLFKQVFRKAAYCTACRLCETNCRHGCLSFKDGLHIEDCVHCGQCHDIEDGCLVYHSRHLPQNGGRPMKSLNSFADHAPKLDWVRKFFEEQNHFLADNTLGPMQISMFKRFLTDAGLVHKNSVTSFSTLITRIGWESEQAWGLILINLVYSNPQIRWYVENMPVGEGFSRDRVEAMLTSLGISVKDAKSIVKAFKRLCELPLGKKLNFGTVIEEARQVETLARCKAAVRDNRVVLYALYKFAEACEGYYQFTLTRLLDHGVISAGVSPTKLFGLERDEMERILLGLTATYPEFINATFTHDLDKIDLREDKKSADVLALF